jgi:Protein of unknown function (DUF2752)
MSGVIQPLSRSAPTAFTGGRRAVLLPLGVGAAALAATAYVAAVDPNVGGHYPTCPFLAITGWYCPGCGALRAVHALAHGDLATALARNPFAVVALVYVVIGWALWLERTATGRARRWLAPPWVLYSVLGVILTFWVLRNVPGWTWLSPA